jgi:hypothetical protein
MLLWSQRFIFIGPQVELEQLSTGNGGDWHEYWRFRLGASCRRIGVSAYRRTAAQRRGRQGTRSRASGVAESKEDRLACRRGRRIGVWPPGGVGRAPARPAWSCPKGIRVGALACGRVEWHVGTLRAKTGASRPVTPDAQRIPHARPRPRGHTPIRRYEFLHREYLSSSGRAFSSRYGTLHHPLWSILCRQRTVTHGLQELLS